MKPLKMLLVSSSQWLIYFLFRQISIFFSLDSNGSIEVPLLQDEETLAAVPTSQGRGELGPLLSFDPRQHPTQLQFLRMSRHEHEPKSLSCLPSSSFHWSSCAFARFLV